VRWLTIDPARGRQDEPVVALVEIGGVVAEDLHGIAPFR